MIENLVNTDPSVISFASSLPIVYGTSLVLDLLYVLRNDFRNSNTRIPFKIETF